jgi:lipopolysaccharide export system permease protein
LRELLLTTFLATLTLTGILLYGNAVRSHEELFQALTLSSGAFLELLGFLVPYSMSYGVPFGFSLAILFCFGRLSSDKEILAYRSLGLGIGDWGKPVFTVSILLSVFSLYANLQWAPVNRAKFDSKKEEVLWANLHTVLEREGEFQFPIDQDLNEESAKSLRYLTGSKLTKVVLSVGEIHLNEWRKIRISLFGHRNELHSIVHAKTGIVRKGDGGAQLVLDLRDLDVESVDSEEKVEGGSSDLFVSFEKWTHPLVLDLAPKDKSQNIKRLGFFELLEFATNRKGDPKGKEASALLHKNSALGLSPFFLSFTLLPLALSKGRKESMGNMAFGVFVAVAYYGVGNFSAQSVQHELAPLLGWWVPNAICFVFGSYFLLRFESS